jgi:hypothetical protein|tara:strand:+ start:19311 stop:19514 length:204 start_codon:yes stop_codon:yes gene_type:complete
MRTMIALFITYRPLLYALVEVARAMIKATSKDSTGGRRIMPEERPPINDTMRHALWTAYDSAMAKGK